MDKNPVIGFMRMATREDLSGVWMGQVETLSGSSNMNLAGYGTVVGNTSSHWANLDLPRCESAVDPWLSPASEDDLIQRLIQMLFVARRDLEALQEIDAVHLPESFTLSPLDAQRIQVKITKTKAPKFRFIED